MSATPSFLRLLAERIAYDRLDPTDWSLRMGLVGGEGASVELRRAAAVIETTARQNLLQALNSQQTVRMELSAGAFGASEEFSGMLQVRRFGESNFRAPKRGEAWEFSPTGICEPIEVRLSGTAGQIEIGFDPLTACAKRKSIQVKG